MAVGVAHLQELQTDEECEAAFDAICTALACDDVHSVQVGDRLIVVCVVHRRAIVLISNYISDFFQIFGNTYF